MDNKYNLPLLYNNRSEEDKDFIKEVCAHILSQPLVDKEYSNDFAAIYVEGRSREFCLEDLASLWSFKAFSQKNYPIFLFLHDTEKFLEGFDKLNIKYDFRLVVNKIDKLDSLETYSNFCIKQLYFRLPPEIDNVITLQPDGMLLQTGFEDWLIKKDFSLIGAKWMHETGIGCLDDEGGSWAFKYPPVSGCNLGFSFRKVSKMREISNIFAKYKLAQWGDINCPEDAFFSYFGFGEKICKLPTREEMDLFSVDPLDKESFLSKRSLGFHFFKKNN